MKLPPAFRTSVTSSRPIMGLSYARNPGAAAAKGEVFAYTDCDCMADPDWLYYLIGTLLSGDYAGVGGPNVSPPAVNWIQAASPPRPADRATCLLTDVVAEHIPGCNMAFYRWAFESVGGFDPEYRKAGDDVDFCWRLQQEGRVIAFSPTAHRLALPAFHAHRVSQAAGRLRRSGSDAALQAPDLLRPDRHREMERPNLRSAALQLVH